jgi:hypothetical protein
MLAAQRGRRAVAGERKPRLIIFRIGRKVKREFRGSGKKSEMPRLAITLLEPAAKTSPALRTFPINA